MKTIRTALTLLLAAVTCGAVAQETPPARDVSIRVLNRRGNPVPEVVVQSVPGGDLGATDENGNYIFRDLAAKDEIRIFFSSGRQAIIPAEGLDSLVVIMRRNRFDYASLHENQPINTGYGTVTRRDNLEPTNVLDVPKIVRESGVTNLYSLLQGRIPGLTIAGESALIRGQRSILGGNEPLVVVDGTIWDSLQQANSLLNVYDIKTVTVLKDGSMYGSRGANGVILITTK